MKKIFLILTFLLLMLPTFAETESPTVLINNSEVYYSKDSNTWSSAKLDDNSIMLTKTLVEGTGSYSRYNYSEDSLAFALATDYEFLKNGKLIIVDNNLLSYSQMIYDGENFQQIPLNIDEIQEVFQDAEILRVSNIDDDNKTWLHKPFLKKKTILLVNDTDKCFHKLTTKSKNVQDEEIKGLLTFSRYGYYKFKHFGQRDGKLIFYIR